VRQRFASAVSCPSSEAELCPRVTGPTVWWAVGATWAVGPRVYLTRVLGSFAFCFFEVSGFSLVVYGTLMAVPDSSPRAFAGVSVGIP
jgi:hypothetical protein